MKHVGSKITAVVSALAVALLAASFLTLTESTSASAAGGMTYEIVKSANPSPDELDAYWRIDQAMSSAVDLWNKNSDVQIHETVYYDTSVPTANGGPNGSGGTIRFGWNRVFMVTGTALHEIAHTIGVGTDPKWWSSLCVNGVWEGDNAKALIQEFDGPGARIGCNGGHFWPYGLNYASEFSDTAYARHIALVLAYHKDFTFPRTGFIGDVADYATSQGTSSRTSSFAAKDRNGGSHWSTWPNVGKQDLTLTWTKPVWLNGGGALFYSDAADDQAKGIIPPRSWSVEYLDAAGVWRPVEVTSGAYSRERDVWNPVTFTPVQTASLRYTFDAWGGWTYGGSTGVTEVSAIMSAPGVTPPVATDPETPVTTPPPAQNPPASKPPAAKPPVVEWEGPEQGRLTTTTPTPGPTATATATAKPTATPTPKPTGQKAGVPKADSTRGPDPESRPVRDAEPVSAWQPLDITPTTIAVGTISLALILGAAAAIVLRVGNRRKRH